MFYYDSGWLSTKLRSSITFLVLQEAALQGSVIAICLGQLTDSSALLRHWLALCLAKVLNNFSCLAGSSSTKQCDSYLSGTAD